MIQVMRKCHRALALLASAAVCRVAVRLLLMWLGATLSSGCSGGPARESSLPDRQGAAPAAQQHANQAKTRLNADEIDVRDLPMEAQLTLRLIKTGGPFPYPKDGTVFGNRELQLPQYPRGYYHEYTVKTRGAKDRGARRIIAGKKGELYYTDDHYRSFKRIRE